MSNFLADPSKWRDWDYNTPPIWWNPDTGAYEVLIDNEYGSASSTIIESTVAAPAGSTIAFDYIIDSLVAYGDTGYHTLYLRLYDLSTWEPVWQVEIPAMGRWAGGAPPEEWPLTGSVEVPCEAGHTYSLVLSSTSGYGFPLYGFEAIIVPVGGGGGGDEGIGLIKDYGREIIPGQPGSPGSPAQPERTVCSTPAAPGYWTQTCKRVEIGNGVAIPPGGELVVVYDPNGTIDPKTGQVKVIDSYIRVCTSTWVSTGPAGPVSCVTYPAQPAVPPQPARPSVVRHYQVLAWNAGANSVVTQEGDCVCTFTMKRVVGVVVGLTAQRENVTDYQRLTHALYFHSGRFNVMERGTVKSDAFAYANGDEFKIQRVRNEVTYIHNGKRVYTSRLPSSGEVSVGCALYASGDAI